MSNLTHDELMVAVRKLEEIEASYEYRYVRHNEKAKWDKFCRDVKIATEVQDRLNSAKAHYESSTARRDRRVSIQK